jgi:hypothetical protein
VNGANSVAFTYDDDGLSLTVDGLTITRDPTNGLITDTTLSSVTDHRTYDGFGQLATTRPSSGPRRCTRTATTCGTRSAASNRRPKPSRARRRVELHYDTAGRLWQVMQNGVLTATYGYDANGNR